MKHRQGLAAALLFCVMCTPVLMGAAAEPEPETQDGETAQVETPPQPALYPIDIVYSEDDTAWRLEKVYQLDASADPSVIPTENFEQEGWEYVFLELLAEDQRETDTNEHIEQITQESCTKDTETVLKNLAPTLEYAGEDGYTGILTLDTASVKVEAAGYGSRSQNVTTTRTYPNLADADTSYIPKTVEEDGCTMELVDVSWQTAAADEVSGQSVATRYTAVASYAGTKTSQYVKGYVVTADGVNSYFGEIHTLKPGATIQLTTKIGTRQYQVDGVAKIAATDVSVLSARDNDIITLITCVRDQPEYRWCVQAKLVR